MRRLVVLLVVVVLLSVVALVASRPELSNAPEAPRTVDRVEVTTSSTERVRRPRAGSETRESAPELALEIPTDEFAMTSGRVVWPDGSPAVDAHVVLGDLDDSEDVTRTDERGEFGFDIIAHYSTLTALTQRAGAQWRASEDVDGWPVQTTLRLRRSPASETVHLVRVRGHDGGAIHGALALVVSGTPRFRPRRRFVPELHARGGEFVVVPESWDPLEPLHVVVHSPTDAEGAPLPYGPALIELDPWGRERTEVFLPPGRALSGRVLRSEGSPVAGADVQLAPPHLDGYDADHMERFGLATTTDADGRYTYHGVIPGACWVSVSAEPGVHAGTATVEVPDGEQPPNLVVRSEIHVTFRVTDPTGTPLTGARVLGVGRRSEPANAAGVVRVGRLMPDKPLFYDIAAPGHATKRVRLLAPVDGEHHDIVLHPARPIRGTVLGPDLVMLRDLTLHVDGVPAGVQPKWDEQGFLLRAVPASATVRVGVRLGHSDTVWTSAASGSDDVTLSLPPTEGLVLYVAGASDHPASIRGPDGELARRDRWGALLDFDTDSWPETVDVLVGPGDDETVVLARDLPSTGFHRLDLAPGHTFRLTLGVPDDIDARLTRARLVHDSGFEFPLDVRSAYRHEARGLPPGDYELHVSPPGGRATIVRRIHLDADQELELEIR